MIKVLPPSLGKDSSTCSTETWVLKPVVAPQFLENTIALNFPEGELMVCTISLPQEPPHPLRNEMYNNRMGIMRLTFLAL